MTKKESKSGNKMGRRQAGMRILGILGVGGSAAEWYETESLKHMVVEPGAQFNRGILDRLMAAISPPARTPAHERADLIRDLFLDVNVDTDLIPPSDWPPQLPDVEVSPDLKTYAHEWHVMNAIRGFLPESMRWEVSDKAIFANPTRSQICLGSGVSNLATRDVLGDAKRPTWATKVGDNVIGLPYAMAYVEGEVERLQYGREYRGPESVIKSVEKEIVARPDVVRGKLVEDYLLITRIPGPVPGTTRTYFAGLHGPGTRSTELLFQSVDPKELVYLADSVKLRSRRPTPYFQAVFRARGFTDVEGSVVATEVTCMRKKCPPIGLQFG